MATVVGHVEHEVPWTYINSEGKEITVPAGEWSALDCGHAVPGRMEGPRLEYERDGTVVRIPGESVDHTCEDGGTTHEHPGEPS